MSRYDEPDRHEEEPRVVVRDKRRIDPETGELRTPAPDPAATAGVDVPTPGAASTGTAPTATASTGAAAGVGAVAAAQAQLAERTADVQRVSAEYANYRKRVDRDRALVSETATANVLAGLVPVLDDIDRAREHGDLTGAFKAVADQLDGALAKLGLTAFGEVGDPFDPTTHEAVTHSLSADVTEPTCVFIMRKGYRVGPRLLRPAMVAVSEPGETPEPTHPAAVPGPAEARVPETAVDAPTPPAGDDDVAPETH